MKIKNWEDLQPEAQQSIRRAYLDLEIMIKFANKLNPEIMDTLFGKQLGPHMWETFVLKADRNIISFLNKLSTNN